VVVFTTYPSNIPCAPLISPRALFRTSCSKYSPPCSTTPRTPISLANTSLSLTAFSVKHSPPFSSRPHTSSNPYFPSCSKTPRIFSSSFRTLLTCSTCNTPARLNAPNSLTATKNTSTCPRILFFSSLLLSSLFHTSSPLYSIFFSPSSEYRSRCFGISIFGFWNNSSSRIAVHNANTINTTATSPTVIVSIGLFVDILVIIPNICLFLLNRLV
ncbi:hypothetical protein AX774_g3511, partial [Zancudomyces culisetae]